MDKHIESKFGRNETAMDVYRFWMDKIEEKGPDEVFFVRDVMPSLQKHLNEKGISVGQSYLANEWKEIKEEIVHFVERVRDWKLSQRLRKKLKVAEIVATENFFNRFASWMLELIVS